MLLKMLFTDLKDTKPSIKAVKELIQGLPFAVLLIQSALWYDAAAKCVPILAKQRIKHEAGGRGMRG